MSKRFRGLICVYCAKEPAITGDHIFAREFFPEPRRDNLPQVPVCAACNNDKAKLEHYLTAVLPFGGRHPDASTNLALLAPKRLRGNLKLHRQLSERFTGNSIPIDGEKLEQLFGLIARGLVWYHWKVYINQETHRVRSVTVTPSGAQALDDFIFKRNARDRVSKNIGNGAFIYEGLEATDDPALTFWRFSIYGGLVVATGASSEPLASQFIAFTFPKKLDADFCRIFHIGDP